MMLQFHIQEVTAIDLTVTLHIDHTTDHPCTEAHHTTLKIETCHIQDHPTNPHDEIHIGHAHTPVRSQSKPNQRTPD